MSYNCNPVHSRLICASREVLGARVISEERGIRDIPKLNENSWTCQSCSLFPGENRMKFYLLVGLYPVFWFHQYCKAGTWCSSFAKVDMVRSLQLRRALG